MDFENQVSDNNLIGIRIKFIQRENSSSSSSSTFFRSIAALLISGSILGAKNDDEVGLDLMSLLALCFFIIFLNLFAFQDGQYS